jgi:hypothetical protein
VSPKYSRTYVSWIKDNTVLRSVGTKRQYSTVRWGIEPATYCTRALPPPTRLARFQPQHHLWGFNLYNRRKKTKTTKQSTKHWPLRHVHMSVCQTLPGHLQVFNYQKMLPAVDHGISPVTGTCATLSEEKRIWTTNHSVRMQMVCNRSVCNE